MISTARMARTLAAGRAAAEARMTSRVTVRRSTGRTTQDENTGREMPVWDVVASDVPFRLKGGAQRGITIAGVEYSEATAVGNLPADLADLEDNDLLDVTDGEWSGSAYRVVEAVKGDQQTARRVPVVEVERPAEWS